MFFHPVLLHIQHKGRLGLAWKAATLGIKNLKALEVRECNIIELCKFIMQFLTSQSHDPKKRLSLRLSIILVNGTVLLWRQQLILLEGDIMSAIFARKRAMERQYARYDYEDESPPTPKPKEKKKKTKKTKALETPEFLAEENRRREERAEADALLRPLTLPEILEENIVQARVDEITLREDIPVQQNIMDDFGDEFLLQPEIERIATQSLHQITVQADVHVPPRDKTMETELIVPEVQLEVPAEVPQPVQLPEENLMEIQTLLHLEEPPVVPPEQILEVPLEQHLVPPPEEPAITVVPVEEEPPTVKEIRPAQKTALRDEPLEAARAPEFPEVTTMTTAKKISDMVRIKRIKKKSVYIDVAIEVYSEDDFTELPQHLPAFRPIDKFWPDIEHELVPLARDRDEQMSVPRRTGTKGSSILGSLRRDTTGTPSVLTERSSILKDTISPLKRSLDLRDETHIAELPPAANHHVVEPALKKKIISVEKAEKRQRRPEKQQDFAVPVAAERGERERPEKEPEQAEIPMEQEIVVPAVELVPVPEEQAPMAQEIEQALPQLLEQSKKRREIEQRRGSIEDEQFGIQWSTEILNIVSKQEKVRPVEICRSLGKRLTKRNMAVLFATLLVLAKDRSVHLLPASDSIELEFVQCIM